MGSSKTTNQTTTNASTPWSAVEPYLKDIMGEAEGLYNSKAGSTYFPGQTVADYSKTTKDALSGISNMADKGMGSQAATQAMGQASKLIGQGGYNADMTQAANQYSDIYGQTDQNFNQALDFQMGKAGDDMARRLAGSGIYGGGTVGSDFGKVYGGEMAGQRAMAMSNNYNNLQQQKLAATGGLGGLGQAAVGNVQGLGGLLPTLNEAQYYDQNQKLGVGQALDAKNQEKIQAEIDKWNFNQAAPWQSLQNYQQAIMGTGQGYGTQKSTAPVTKPSTLQQVVGTITGAAGTAGKLYGG